MSRFIGFFLNARTRLLQILGDRYDALIKKMEVKDRCVLLKLISANVISIRDAQQYLAKGLAPDAVIRHSQPIPRWFHGLRILEADGIAAKIIAAIKRGQLPAATPVAPKPIPASPHPTPPPPPPVIPEQKATPPPPVAVPPEPTPVQQDYRVSYEPPRDDVLPQEAARPSPTRGDDISQAEMDYIEANVQRWLDDPATGLPIPQGNPRPITADRLTVVGPGRPSGDITLQPVEAIVNAAQPALTGGGGIDGAIHGAAGSGLYNYCVRLPIQPGGARCPTGAAAITPSFGIGSRQPAIKHIIHTVGPVGSGDLALASAYLSCYRLVALNGITSIAFCGISVGLFGFPKGRGAKIAMLVSRLVLPRLPQLEKVIFACTDPAVHGPFSHEATTIVTA